MTSAPILTRRTSLILAGGALLLPSAVSAKPVVAQPAPVFTGLDSNGRKQSLADYRGKTVVLEWTNHECPYVGKHYRSSNMQAIQKDVVKAGGVWLSIISSEPGSQGFVSPAKANDLTRSRDASPTAVILDPDGVIGRAYDARVTPHMFIIDARGTLVYMGGIDSIRSTGVDDVPKAKPYVRDALKELAAGKPITTPVTNAYGCTIKFKPTA
ncbi:MAG: redoxin domain-containing protein [Alphaproteobacteria bacterium]|nr:redoxin domain-containing protein [Alphaproteobacteria bacterium]MCW5741877.1 redoxin domain-containing protein [Alphaproteobacteria bacterium]